jgi:hypothetical protein
MMLPRAGDPAARRGTSLAFFARQEDTMAHVITRDGLVGFVEHALFVIVGFVLMVIGLGMGVTMVMLPVGLVIGLAGFSMFVAGLFVRMKK